MEVVVGVAVVAVRMGGVEGEGGGRAEGGIVGMVVEGGDGEGDGVAGDEQGRSGEGRLTPRG